MNVGRRQIVAAPLLVLGGSVGVAYALGLVGAPAVESVENRFTGVSTTVETALTVNNPAGVTGSTTDTVTGGSTETAISGETTPTDNGMIDR